MSLSQRIGCHGILLVTLGSPQRLQVTKYAGQSSWICNFKHMFPSIGHLVSSTHISEMDGFITIAKEDDEIYEQMS